MSIFNNEEYICPKLVAHLIMFYFEQYELLRIGEEHFVEFRKTQFTGTSGALIKFKVSEEFIRKNIYKFELDQTWIFDTIVKFQKFSDKFINSLKRGKMYRKMITKDYIKHKSGKWIYDEEKAKKERLSGYFIE